MTEGWGIPVDAGDALRQMHRRTMRQERRPAAKSLESILGGGMAAMAVQILDWNSIDTLLNGYYYSEPGAVNTPNVTLSWTGQTIAKDDGSGMQQVWNTDGATTLYWMRTYEPNVTEDGNVTFGPWKKFATPSGYVGEDEINPPVMDTITDAYTFAQQALLDAEAAMDYALTGTRVFRQPTAPTALEAGEPLKDGWVWFDTDASNAIYVYDTTVPGWVPGGGTDLTGLQADIDAAQAAADAAQADAEQAILDAAAAASAASGAQSTANTAVSDAAAAQADADSAATTAGNALSAAAAAQADADAALGKFPITTTDISDNAISTPKLQTNSVTTTVLAADAITAKHTITGAVLQTEATVSRGIKISSTGMTAYDAAGNPTFTITASSGAVSMLGALTSGSTITGATITSGVIQTSPAASTGIKISGSGLIGYGSGVAKFTLTTTGNLSVDGPVVSGGTITGAVLQTDAAAATGIKISTSGGIVGYGGGVAKFTLTPAGALTVTGPVVSGGAIDGATVTGGVLQTSSAASTGIKMNSTGFTAYDSVGAPTFTITAATGAVAMKGDLVSGSTITGATITGSTVQTAASGQRLVVRQDVSGGLIEFFSGLVSETTPGRMNPSSTGSRPSISLETGKTSTYTDAPRLVMRAGDPVFSDPTAMHYYADLHEFRDEGGGDTDVSVIGTLDVTGTTTLDSSLTVLGNVTVDGGVRIGANANRTFIMHSASITMSTNASGEYTWNHNLALGTLTYQCIAGSRANGAQRVFTVVTKNANSTVFRVENASGATVNSANVTADVIIIG